MIELGKKYGLRLGADFTDVKVLSVSELGKFPVLAEYKHEGVLYTQHYYSNGRASCCKPTGIDLIEIHE